MGTRIVIGLDNLKDEFRIAKLKCGDLRGLKNAFELSRKFNIPQLQTYFFKSGGSGSERMELVADCYAENSDRLIFAYTMGDLIEQMKDETESYDVHLICQAWDKSRNNANRKEVSNFSYRNKN